jgi:hypothetical protein
MAMENKRIIQLSTERTTLDDDDYTIVDSGTNGTAKYRLSRLKETDTTLSVSGMAADAAATGQAISAETQARTQAVTAETQARQQAITAELQARQAADTTLGNDVEDLKSAIDYYKQNLSFSESGYVMYNNGNIAANANYTHTDYVELQYQEKILVQCGFAYDAGIAFYDIDKNYLDGFRASTNDFGEIVEIIVPDNTRYYRISKNINYITSVWYKYDRQIKNIEDSTVNKIAQCVLQPVETAEITNKAGYYDRTGFHSGEFTAAEYACSGGERIKVTCSGNASFAGYYFYDSSGWCIGQGIKDKKFTDYDIVVPINAAAIGLNKLSGTEGIVTTLSVKKASTDNPYVLADIYGDITTINNDLVYDFAWHRMVEDEIFSGVYLNNSVKFVENGPNLNGYATKIYDVSDIRKIRFSGNPYSIGYEDYEGNVTGIIPGEVTNLEIDVTNYRKFFVSGSQSTFYGMNYNRVDGYFKLETKWTNKKIVWFGTSIPAGGYKGSDNPTSYPLQVGYKLGANVINEAVGTSCIVCRDPDRVTATNPYGFHTVFESASRCLTNTIEMMEWISNWADYYCNGGTYQNEEDWDETIFTQMLPTTWDASKRADIIGFSYENKLDQYLTNANEPDLFVFDHGYNDNIRWRDNENKYEEYLPTYGPDACFTFRGSMNFLLRRILSFDPHIRIVMIGDYGNQNENKKYDSKYQMIVAENWELPLYKEWENTGWSLQEITTNYYWNNGCWTKGNTSTTMSILATWLADGIHPHSDKTGNANRLITELISGWLLTE